jgi:hypothetical protein
VQSDAEDRPEARGTGDDFGGEEEKKGRGGCASHSKSNSVSLFQVSFLNSFRRRRPYSSEALFHFILTTTITISLLHHSIFDFLIRKFFETSRCLQEKTPSTPLVSTEAVSKAVSARKGFGQRKTKTKN